MTLTKAGLATTLQEELGLNLAESRELVDLFFEEIRCSLAQGNDVKLSRFGNFLVRHKRERPGLNPVTGAIHRVSARTIVRFQPGNKLRVRVMGPPTIDADSE